VGLRERIAAAAPARNAALILAGLVVALAVLTALVWAGSLTRLDQFSVDHLMPWLRLDHKKEDPTKGLYRPFGLHSANEVKLLALYTYPCSILISTIVVVWAGIVLWRRYGPIVGLLPAAAWLIGNGAEVVGKHLINRPLLLGNVDGERVHIKAFESSYPSGHMLRGVIVAFTLALVFERAWKALAVWAIFVGPALVLESAHTVTDVVGGALVGLILLVVMLGVVRAETRAPA
jgi:membrane-associated phospholipid phosphatase